jgi:Exopolysaccharide biosynthesis protein YbjH
MAVLELGCCSSAFAETATEAPTYLPPSMNDWAEYGLLQDPSARTGTSGDFNLQFDQVLPYDRYEIQATPFPWLETTFRYTSIENRFYGPKSFSGSQSYKDRSFGLKLRLIKESEDFPAMAIGIRDIAGTGLFGSEYLVFSRRYYNWDFTWGMGWGLMGTQDALPNPLGWIIPSMKTRPISTSGAFTLDYFRGPHVGLFGGFEYHTPIKGLSLKLELDPDSYQEEPLGNRFTVRAPINVGVDYKLLSFVDLSAGFERGDTAMLRFTIHGNFDSGPLLHFDTPPPPVKPRPLPKPAVGTPLDQTSIPQVASAGAGATGGPAAEGSEDVYYHEGRPLDQTQIPQVAWAERAGLEAASEAGTPGASLLDGGQNPVDQLYSAANRLGYDIKDVSLDGDTAVVHASVRPGAEPAPKAQLVRLVDAEIHDVSQTKVTISPAEPPFLPKLVSSSESLKPAPRLRLMSEVRPPPTARPDVRAIAAKIFTELAAMNFTGESFAIRGDHAYLAFSQDKYRDLPIALGRAARVVMQHLPPNVEAITLDLRRQGVTMLSVTLMRRDLERGIVHLGSPEEIWADAHFSNTDPDRPIGIRNEDAYPRFDWSLDPRTRQQIGGPNSFLLYQIYADVSGSANLRPGLSVTGDVGINLYNDFNKLTLASNSTLPHVRSDIAKYLKQGANGIYRLQADYMFNIAPSLYGRLSAGYLEEMFAGVDGEVLYRPYDERWAVGLDLNHVYQRAYNDLFGLRKYNVTTGHLSFYYQLPWYHVLAHLYVGQYLAGDRGATIEISRRFESGVTIGAFATKTNVSAAQFGEGSFDKGFFISIPLDLLFGQPTKQYASYVFRPLTRDGGQMLGIANPLYGVTDGTDAQSLAHDWPSILQ